MGTLGKLTFCGEIMSNCTQATIGDEEILAKLRESEVNTNFLFGNMKQLQEDYGEKYVAISKGKLIDANEDIEELRITLMKKGENITEVLIEFIYSDKIIWIL